MYFPYLYGTKNCKTILELSNLINFSVSSGPQFANIIMDHCQMPGSGKIEGGIRIKQDPNDYAEAGEKCDIHDKKGSK